MAFEKYFDLDGIYAEDELYVLRKLKETDKEPFMQLLLDASDMRKAYDHKEFYEYSWESSLNDEETLYLSLIDKNAGNYLGKLTVRNLKDAKPEIGCGIVKEYRNQGIAYRAMKMLIDRTKELMNVSTFEIKAYKDNLPSLHLIHKLGGIEMGREENEFISIFAKGAEITGENLLEEDNGLNKEVVRSLLDRYIKVFEIRT